MKYLSAFFLSLAFSLPVFSANVVKTPTTYSSGSSLTIQTGVVVTFAPGSIVNFTGATVTGLPSAIGATIPTTSAILKGDGAGNGAAASASDINGVINGTVAPIFSNISARPTTLSGYGITDAQPIDGDLTAIAALTGTNVIYYRNASNTWLPVTIGTNLNLTSGTLNATTPSGVGGDALVANPLSQFAATTSLQLAGVISNETGTGVLVFGTSPVFTTDITTPKIIWTGTTVTDTSGAGSPEGVVTAGIGSTYRRTNGGASTTFYYKQSGVLDTGWVPAVAAISGDINSIINGSVAPVFSNLTSKPITAVGYGITNGVSIDSWGALTSTAPVFSTSVTSPKYIFTGNVIDTFGTGSPEGVVTASVGSTYRQTNGAAGTTFYRKETGTGNTGWTSTSAGGGGTIASTMSLLKGTGTGGATGAAGSDVVSAINTVGDLTLSVTGDITFQPGLSKTVQLKQAVIVDPTDPTKRVQELVSGITTGTTRTNTHPDADTTAVVSNQPGAPGTWVSAFNPDGTFTFTAARPTDLVPNELVVGNVNTPIVGGSYDAIKLGTVLTQTQIFTFPDAAAYNSGETLKFYSPFDSAGNIARVTSASGDLFNGASSMDISEPYFSRVFISDGVSNWTVSLSRNVAQPFKVLAPSSGIFTLVSDPNSAKQNASMTLATGVNNLAITNPFDGMQIELILMQNGTGSGTLNLPPVSRTSSGGGGAVTLTATANAVDRLKGIYYSTGGYYLWDPVILNSTATTLPPAPSALAGTPINASKVDLTWTDNSTNENGFVLERSLSASGGFALVANLAANTTAYSDLSTTGATTYYYSIKAQNAGGFSGASTSTAITTQAGGPAADLMEWHFDEGSLSVVGANIGPAGTMTYPVWTSSTQASAFAFNPVVGMSPAGSMTVIPQGTPGTTSYTYKVLAFKTADGTHNSATTVTTTTGNATLGVSNFNRITWGAVMGADYYAVYRSASSGTPSSIGKISAAGLTAITMDDNVFTTSGSVPSNSATSTNTYTATANSAVTYGNVISVSFWANSTFAPTVFTDIINGGGNSFRIQELTGATPKMQFTMPGTTGTTLQGTIVLTGFTSGWNHYVVVMDQRTSPGGGGAPTGSFTAYINGNSTPRTLTYLGGGITHTGSPNFVAGAPVVGSTFFAGAIDDLRIYNRALNTTEIAALYNGNAQ